MQLFIALLRAVNASGHNKIVMADLRAACDELGWHEVQSYIQSGNLIFQADKEAAVLEGELEEMIAGRFGLTVPVMVRTAVQWAAYLNDNPYPRASQQEPNRVMLALSKEPPNPNAVSELRQYATGSERITQIRDALWIHFGDGAGKSRLSPAVFDRLVGSPVTMRNWRTVVRLGELSTARKPDLLRE